MATTVEIPGDPSPGGNEPPGLHLPRQVQERPVVLLVQLLVVISSDLFSG